MQSKKTGLNSGDIQEINRLITLSILRKSKICSRIELVKKTGLRQSTITNIINEFIDIGVVKEVGALAGQKGRRSVGITLNESFCKIIAVKLTRKHFVVGLYDIVGNEYYCRQERIQSALSINEVIEQIIGAVLLLKNNSVDVIGVGVAIPGPFLMNESKIMLMSNFMSWAGINLKEEFENRIGLPVYFEHDAKAAAIAEWWLGKHKSEVGILACMLVGQGIGCGLVVDGTPFKGAQGIAGEIGHVSISYAGKKCECGNSGCLELYASSIALVKNAEANLKHYKASLLNNCELNPDNIFQAMRDGDELALKCVKEAGTYLGYGVVTIINTYNPNIIIIGDELAGGGEVLLKSIRDVVKKRVMKDLYDNLTLDISSFTHDPIMIGAVMTLVNNVVLRNPAAKE